MTILLGRGQGDAPGQRHRLMKGVEELVSQGPEYLGISKAKVVGKTVSSPALGQLGDFFFFFLPSETEMQEKWCRAVYSTDLTTPR